MLRCFIKSSFSLIFRDFDGVQIRAWIQQPPTFRTVFESVGNFFWGVYVRAMVRNMLFFDYCPAVTAFEYYWQDPSLSRILIHGVMEIFGVGLTSCSAFRAGITTDAGLMLHGYDLASVLRCLSPFCFVRWPNLLNSRPFQRSLENSSSEQRKTTCVCPDVWCRGKGAQTFAGKPYFRLMYLMAA